MSEQEEFFDLKESIDIVSRRKWEFLMAFGLVLAVGIAIAVMLPPTFRAESKILIERQEIPDSLVATTVTGYVAERIEVLSQRALTSKKLKEIGLKVGLIREPQDAEEEESEEYQDYVWAIVDTMKDSAFVEMVDVEVAEQRSASKLTIAFTIAYEDSDAEMASEVANALTDLFLSENTAFRADQAGKVTSFLNEAAGRVNAEIAEIESKIANLKQQNFELLPDQLIESRASLTDLENNLIALKADISFLESRKSQLQDQLAQTNRYIISEKSSIGELQDPVVRLEKAQLELRAALETYTEEHPDVKRLRQLIDITKREIASGAGGSASTSRQSEPTNPEYLRKQGELNDIDGRLKVAEATREQTEQRIRDLSAKLIQNPGIELTYNSLLRNLERAQNEYKDIKDRQYQAQLAESLESEAKGERFTLLSRASPPRLPIKPNRIGIVLLAAFFGMLAGGGRVIIAESRDSVVRTSKDVLKIFGAKPIGVIPVIDMTNV